MRLIDADNLIELERKALREVYANLYNATTETQRAYWRGVLIERQLMIEFLEKQAQIENAHRNQ